jgi:hypothetical protein
MVVYGGVDGTDATTDANTDAGIARVWRWHNALCFARWW